MCVCMCAHVCVCVCVHVYACMCVCDIRPWRACFTSTSGKWGAWWVWAEKQHFLCFNRRVVKLTFGAGESLVLGGCLVYCRMSAAPQITCMCPPQGVTIKTVSRHCQMSPGGKTAPVENHCFHEIPPATTWTGSKARTERPVRRPLQSQAWWTTPVDPALGRKR
jgi:hypothetical protein